MGVQYLNRCGGQGIHKGNAGGIFGKNHHLRPLCPGGYSFLTNMAKISYLDTLCWDQFNTFGDEVEGAFKKWKWRRKFMTGGTRTIKKWPMWPKSVPLWTMIPWPYPKMRGIFQPHPATMPNKSYPTHMFCTSYNIPWPSSTPSPMLHITIPSANLTYYPKSSWGMCALPSHPWMTCWCPCLEMWRCDRRTRNRECLH